METINKAKADLILDHPFFASLLLSMPMIEDKRVPTMGTDGVRIVYNPEFMAKMTRQETVFILAHEVMHCVFQHMFTRGSRDKAKWNVAGDYIINELLVKESIGAMPKGCLQNSGLVAKGNNTTLGVYDLLPDMPPMQGTGQGHGNGGSLDEISEGQGDAAEQATAEAEMKVRVIQAANAAKMQGRLSAGLARLVSEAVKPSVDWRTVLRRFLTERCKTDWTYAKPKRRFLAEDLYLPGLTGERMGEVVIAVDCSGSIDEKTLNKFAAEIRGIHEDASPQAVHVLYFDSRVVRHDSFTADDTLTVTACGGGGTAFSPIWEYVDKQGWDPAACVVLTDLCCNDFGPAPAYPVLWAATMQGSAPFGDIVEVKDK